MNRRKDDQNRVLKDREYQRKNGSYEFKWTSNNGKRHSIYAKTLEELRAKEEQLLKDRFDGIKTTTSIITLNQAYESWKKTKRNTRDSTQYQRELAYNKHIRDKYGGVDIKKFKKSDIVAIYYEIYDSGLMVSSIGRINEILIQIFGMLVEDGILRTNPVKGAFKTFKPTSDEKVDKPKALTKSQQREFEEFITTNKKCKDIYPLLEILLWTGMRVGEAGALTWDDVDLEQGVIYIRKTVVYVDGKYVMHNTPKTKSSIRKIPMLSNVKEMFLIQKKIGRKSSNEIGGYKDFIFLTNRCNPYIGTSLDLRLKSITDRCNKMGGNLPHISCHTLRHSFATRMCESNVNMKVVQAILGHNNIGITYDTYTTATDDMMLEEFKNIKVEY